MQTRYLPIATAFLAVRPTDGDAIPGFECDIGAVELVPEPGALVQAFIAFAALLGIARQTTRCDRFAS